MNDLHLERGRRFDVLTDQWHPAVYMGQVRITQGNEVVEAEDERIEHAFMRTDVEGAFLYVPFDLVDDRVRLP